MNFLTPEQLIECIKLEIHWKVVVQFWELLFENNPELATVDVTTIRKKDWDLWCTSLQRETSQETQTEEGWILYQAVGNYAYYLKKYEYTDGEGKVCWSHIYGNMWELFIRPFSAKVTRVDTKIYLYEVKQFLQQPTAWRLKFFDHVHLRWNDLDDQIRRAQERVMEMEKIKRRKERRIQAK